MEPATGGDADLVTLDEEFVAEVAKDVRAGPFVRRCLALADWLGPDGKPVTGSGVLAVAAARTAYEELGLGDLSEPSTPRGSEEQPSLFGTEQEDALARQSPVRLRSAADLPALQQLWQVGVGSGLVEVNKGVARTGSRNCSSDEDWLLLGTDLAMGRAACSWTAPTSCRSMPSRCGPRREMSGRSSPG